MQYPLLPLVGRADCQVAPFPLSQGKLRRRPSVVLPRCHRTASLPSRSTR
ncbi:hypothetical protein [Ornithinimicrobium kibberense]